MALTVGRIEFGPNLVRDITKMVDKWTFEQKEADVLRACLEWLKVKGYFAWRSNNAGTYNARSGGYFFHGVKGVPDICCVHKGQFIGIECKATKGKQSEAQKVFQKSLEKAGGKYILARSLAALIEEMGDAGDR
jgi:hypothetical protein